MLSVLTFIIFLLYASMIFFVKEYYILGIILLINLCLMVILNINIKKSIIFILKLLPFIIFTALINIFFSDFYIGILIGLRLILVSNITYIFSQKMTPKKLQFVIEKILLPLKILKINPKEIGIIVSISIAFIPIIQKEIENLKFSLLSKGYVLNFRNFIKKPNLIFVPLIISIIKRTSEIELSMVSKGYTG